MSLTFTASSKSSTAPDVEEGLYPADFKGVIRESHPEWTGTNRFGNEDDGERLRWSFTFYVDGDGVDVDGLTNLNLNVTSKTVPVAVRYLKALMTKVEWAKFEAGEGIDAEALLGRRCQLEIAINDNGWPKVVSVIAAPKKGN